MDRNRCNTEAPPNLTQIAIGVQSASLRFGKRVRRPHGPFGPLGRPIGAYRLSPSPRCRGIASEG